MKTILGLDLGTTSIGWALVNEAENANKKSAIIKTGVRIIQLDNFVSTKTGKESKDPLKDFIGGNGISPNAGRTAKRGARRNLQRYKHRRTLLLNSLKKYNLISDETILAEDGKNTTHSLWELRIKAASEQITLNDFAKVLLAINKKRGYKSNRKTNNEDEGQAVDGMEVAKILYDKKITPGQYVLDLFQNDKKHIPDFYRSDLQNEFNKIWDFQQQFYPNILTDVLKEELIEKKKKAVWAICEKYFKEKSFELVGVKRDTKGKELKVENYQWRVEGLNNKLSLEQMVVVFQEINGQINNSSELLGKISDRSKELYFNKQTVGQYLYNQLKQNPHTRLKNQVFYRQDYEDEFNKIWDTQSKYHSLLTDELRKEIRDIVIFYQRRLKSQKGLISICELEGKEKEIIDKEGNPVLNANGEPKRKIVGPRVVPKSSHLFEEFRIWQDLNKLKFAHKDKPYTKLSIAEFDDDMKFRNKFFIKLSTGNNITANQIKKTIFNKPNEWETNLKKDKKENDNGFIEGNKTNKILYKAYKSILELAGYENIDVNDKNAVAEILDFLGIKKEILDFDTELEGKEFEQQLSYQLWHLLYSYEGDDSNTGNDKLYFHLNEKFGFNKEYAKTLVSVTFKDDYGSLSTKAIRKIMPYLKAGHVYSEACALAGYNHSHSLTKEENEKRELKEVLELLPKNSLRNPVVEKILNQMVNVINAIIKEYGKPDEIRIELARELKKSAKERAEMTTHINSANKKHNEYRGILEKEFPPFNKGVRITKNDIIRYKLWLETDKISVYTGKPIKGSDLFTKEYDIEHIIPKAVLFDDSFSNKTLCERELNREKSNTTAYDFISSKYGKDSKAFQDYEQRVEKLYNKGKGVISKAKYNKLLMKGSEIPDGFIERDLRNTQYISKKAKEMLQEVFRTVTPITGIVTSKLRSDWQLINVMQELNWDKYKKLDLTDYEENKDGKKIPVIKDWTKRNDHRHHAMDAITIAFTKHNHIQYYNFLNARKDEKHKEYTKIVKIEKSIIEMVEDKKGNKKRLMKPPMPINEFRAEAKKHLQNTLISFKAKNKVVTRNKNKSKNKVGYNTQETLTPRGQLHKETVYGKSRFYETKLEKIGAKFNKDKIKTVAKKSHREALLTRLAEFDNDPKKAFVGKNALSKKPIYLNDAKTIELPEKVKIVTVSNRFTIRKDITHELKIDKVVDVGVQTVLQKRLDEFKGDPKKAFSNLEDNPIWLNKEKGIQLKRVTITGVSHAEVLHTKKDHFGKEILDENGNQIPADYVSTGNNHHVAIYKDEDGNLQEEVVSFYEAVARVNAELPIIWKEHPEHPDWEFLFTMKQNEMFVFPNEKTDFNPAEIDLLDENNYHLISPNLFRMQKIGNKDYWFRHHLETTITNNLKKTTFYRIQNNNGLKGIVKLRLNHIGKITKVGE